LAEQKRVVRPWLWALIGLVGALLVVSPASSAILTPHGRELWVVRAALDRS
jgi:hypothetical protein